MMNGDAPNWLMQSRIGGGVKAVNGEVGVLIYVHAAAAKRVPRFLIAGPVCAGFLAAAHGILPSTGICTDEISQVSCWYHRETVV